MPRVGLKLEAGGKRGLARVADANAEEAVEVEELRRGQRVDVIFIVEGVEHFDPGYDAEALAEMDRAGDAEVESEEGVVFAEMITAAIDAVDKPSVGVGDAARRAAGSEVGNVGDGLSGMRLHAHVGVKTPREIGDGVEIELVALVAVGVGVFRGEVMKIGVAEGERIALVGVVVFVYRVGVVGVEEEMVAHALPEADGSTTIK